MTGSAGTVLDVMVNAIVSNGRRVWVEGVEISTPAGGLAEFFRERFSSIVSLHVSKTWRLPHF